jgi:branched-chain amino acid transport system permease protein
MELIAISLLNGFGYGLLLFMLSAGLTLVFGLMGVLNLAHASFYMLGAYVAYATSARLGFGAALVVAPAAAFVVGAVFERWCLRAVQRHGHVPELLLTYGLSLLMLEAVQLVWGRAAVDYRVPAWLEGPLFSLYGAQFPAYRGLMMAVSLTMLGLLWALLVQTRAGLVVRAALSQPQMAEALGHDVPRLRTVVFGGGAALAGLAGVIGGNAYVTEPGMAAAVGPIVFVIVVIGGLGSLAGAFVASILIGLLQTLAVAADTTIGPVRLAQIAPLLPYLALVAMLALRPRGLMGTRDV